MKPNTVMLGASHKPHRYSFKAMQKLQQHGYLPILVANQQKIIDGMKFVTLDYIDCEVDTLALYVNPQKLDALLKGVIKIKPRRVIFNPGTESHELAVQLKQQGIEVVEDCVLRMLDGERY